MKTFTLTADALRGVDPRVWSDDMRRAELALAEHAIASYLTPGEYTEAVKAAGFVDGRILDEPPGRFLGFPVEGPAQVAVTWNDDSIVVGGRGSSEAGDWRDDFGSVFRVRWSPPLPKSYHAKRVSIGWGFRRQVNAIGPQLIALLLELTRTYPDAQIFVDGHSLGAAMVRPIVALLSDYGIRTHLAISFEEPRVGNAAWAQWYEDTFDREDDDDPVTPSWSVINVVEGEPDIVTGLPPRWLGFRHAVPRRRLLHVKDRLLFGPEAWCRYRDDHPPPWWRPVSRKARSVRAHLGQQLLATLRRTAGSTVYGRQTAGGFRRIDFKP